MSIAIQRKAAFTPSPSAETVLAESAGDAAFATTLAKGLVVLEAFEAGAPMLGNMELAARTGIPRPTVARLTHTLAELGYLRYDQDLAKYRLGARALRMAHPLLAGMQFRQVARPMMQELAQSVRGTVSIGLLDGTAMIYVETARSGDVGPHTPDIGMPIPVVMTAMGRAAAAATPRCWKRGSRRTAPTPGQPIATDTVPESGNARSGDFAPALASTWPPFTRSPLPCFMRET